VHHKKALTWGQGGSQRAIEQAEKLELLQGLGELGMGGGVEGGELFLTD